jgi:mannose-6-phosphate isomerase-like protein (cupin superfamily)
MTIAPGGKEGGPDNRHRGADQWMFVVAGRGEARIGRRRLQLGPGVLLLIERGEKHEIRNTGRGNLKTLNLYVPPAYTRAGNERSAGKS